MGRCVVLALAVALLALPAARGSIEAPVLAIVSQGTTGDLAWLDPRSLEPLPGTARVPLGLQDIPWAMSQVGSTLAVGSGRATSLVLVDLRSMRRVGRVATAFTTALAWPTPDRLVLLERRARRWWLALIDPTAPAVVSHTPLGGGWYPAAAATTHDGLAILAAPERRVGAPRLLVFDAGGRARRVSLPRIDAGQARKRIGERVRVWYRNPGLAVDVERNRVFVVTAGTRVAEVDLATLAVRYHEVRALHPRSQATGSTGRGSTTRSGGNVLATGTQRQARWLGNGAIAVAGWHTRLVRGGGGARANRDDPAGLVLVDTRAWTARLLAAEARWFHATSDTILARVPPRRLPGTALVGFTHDGSERFRLDLGSVFAGVQTAGTYAYLGLGDSYRPHAVAVVDVHTGEHVGTAEASGWILLLSPSQPQFCWCYTGTNVG